MSDYLPEEIIHKILLNLPVKTLIISTLVCKSWKSLIISSAFIESHLRATIASNNQNDSHLLLISASSYNRDHTRARDQYHWLHWDNPESGEHSMLPTPVILLENKPVSDLGVVGTINGLVCLEKVYTFRDSIPVLIWNPSIRKVVMLPEPPGWFTYDDDRYTFHGFGYDEHSNDYKILRVLIDINNNSDLIGSAVALSPRFTTLVQVYSLARGSWKSLSASVIPVDFKGGSGRPVFVDGTIHMLKARFTSSYYNDGDIVITTFNLATEEFGEMMGPEALLQKGCSISRYGDSLALIKHLNYEFRDRGCDIWVMRQYGVAESWTRLFHISVAQASIHGFKRCGEVVLEENIEEDIDLDRSRLMSFDRS